MGGSVPANVPQDSSRAQSTHFYIGFIHMERLLRKREVAEAGQLWFLQGSLWSCGTQSAQPSGTSAPTLVLLDPVWNGFKDQEDGSAGDVLTAETQGLISEPQQSRGEKTWVWWASSVAPALGGRDRKLQGSRPRSDHCHKPISELVFTKREAWGIGHSLCGNPSAISSTLQSLS